MRDTFEVQAESCNNREGELRLHFNPWLFVIQKNSSRGPKHGQSERQNVFFKAKEMLKKARKENTAAIRRSRICRCSKTMPENARCSPGGDGTNSDTDTSTTSTASTTKSAIRRRRKLQLLCRSQDWMEVSQRATEKLARSIFIFDFAVADFAMANELEPIIWEMVVISVSWKEFQKIDE